MNIRMNIYAYSTVSPCLMWLYPRVAVQGGFSSAGQAWQGEATACPCFHHFFVIIDVRSDREVMRNVCRPSDFATSSASPHWQIS